MGHSIHLTAAAEALVAQFGVAFAASRLGGERRLAAALCDQFAMGELDARSVVTALIRRQTLHWVAERGLPRASCPGILEVCGQWQIDPDRVQEL